MYCIVIRDYEGNYYRVTEEDCPTEKGLKYWEYWFKVWKGGDLPPHEATTYPAVVVNVFEID